MNKKIKRVFLIVLDSVGCGEMPDAALIELERGIVLAMVVRSGIVSVVHLPEELARAGAAHGRHQVRSAISYGER